jgi:hypothetical protein
LQEHFLDYQQLAPEELERRYLYFEYQEPLLDSEGHQQFEDKRVGQTKRASVK